MNKRLIEFQLTAIVVFIRAVNTIVYAIADLFLGDALSAALKSIAALLYAYVAHISPWK